MFCPRCGANVATGKNFCGDCGSPLPMQCRACGGENPPGKKFCAECGAVLRAGSSELHDPVPTRHHRQPVAERRQLTVMFVDLVGSTALGARLDPEDLREVIVAYQACITSIVTRFDGFVARYMGDGALVYFGYPQSHEDDAERAIRAGLAMVDSVRHLSTVAGPVGTLACRVGIATGPVVVGDVIGSGSSLESPVLGYTPNFAAGLVTMAAPGMVAIAETTRRLAGELFDYTKLGPATLKGSATPVYAWAAVAERSVDRFEALRTSNLPLVGRTEEMDLLLRRWEQVRAGEGRVVLLTGEPGIGKSRLVLALAHRVRQPVRAQVRYLCSPHHRDSPLYPVIRQIELTAGFARADTPEVKLDKLIRSLSADAPSDPDVSLIGDLVSIVRTEDALGDGQASPRGKEATLAAILRQFDRLARRGPLLVVFEDIHWADPTTLDLLDLLVKTVERLPVLLVITTRPELQVSWASRPQVTVQSLSGLHRRHAASLIKVVTGERVLPDDVIEGIIGRADGVPLFIEELTKTVIDTRPQQSSAGQHSPSEPISAESVPTTLQASLMARLDRLVAAKEVAQVGSVIGREFSFEWLHRLSGLPAKDLEEALAELLQTGLAIAHGEPPHSTYAFKHALVQDTAYTSLLRERRRTIHLHLAELLEGEISGPHGALPEVIAWHFGEAGAPDRSIDYYLKAAERTTGRFALTERVSHLRKGLRQIEHLHESAETMRRELTLQVALYQVLVDAQGSGSEDVRSAVERARVLCLKLDDTKQLIRVQDGLLNYHFSHSDAQKALHYAGEMLEVANRTGNPQAFLMARKTAGFANLLLGRFESACEDMRLLVETYDEERDGPQSALSTRDSKMGANMVLGICLTALGYPESGAAKSLEAVSHAETLNHAVSRIAALRRACVQHIIQRDSQTVLKLSERLLALAGEFETFKGARDGTLFNCWAKLQTRREAALLERMRGCIEHFDATGYWAMLPFFMASAAEVMAGHGDREGAVALLNRAVELVRLTGEQWSEPEILRLQARLGARDFDHALSLLQASLERARQQHAKLWELRTATSLADLWLERGDHAAAREVLAPVYEWFTEGFRAPDLVDARRLLDRIDGGVATAAAGARRAL